VADTVNASAAPWASIIHLWGCRWGIPGFEASLSIRVSGRLTRSLGRCNPARGTITLRAGLSPDQLPYVLCHEAAHIAAVLLFGPAIKPHGPEWASLVSAAGFIPSVRYPGAPPPAPVAKPAPPGRFRYAHQCLTCQTTRWARRPMRHWRCAECLAAGLAGEMLLIDTQTTKDAR